MIAICEISTRTLAAIQELEEKERDIVVPTTFPRENELEAVAYDFYNFSEGEESSTGPWARGKAPDGRGTFHYKNDPVIYGEEPILKPAPPKIYNTPRTNNNNAMTKRES
ncbi:catalase [Geomicrobium sp. JCM 19055]|nr:catalase [Geomicrobium sp. JCM 19055]